MDRNLAPSQPTLKGFHRDDWPSVHRGGNWGNNAPNCRSAYRNYGAPGSRAHGLGLRAGLVSETSK